MKSNSFQITLLMMLLSLPLSAEQLSQPAFNIKAGLIDTSQPLTLGLKQAPKLQHFSVFKAQANKAQYNHGAVLFGFKGQLFCQWQTSLQDEDGPDTHVMYSASDDGENWSAATVLAPERKNAIVTSGGWWSDGDNLVAFINVWPKNAHPKSGFVEYSLSKDGIHWSEFQPVLDYAGKPLKGVIEQDLKALPNGRVITAVHQAPGLIATPFYTDNPLAIKGWKAGVFQNKAIKNGISKELEPSWFLNKNNDVIMNFRDQHSSFKILAALSKDNGQTWTQALATNMPDSRAKQSAGNLPDGQAYIVNNPTGNKTREPLVLTVSQDGIVFDAAYLLRTSSQRPPLQFDGKYKRVGFSYPKSYVWQNNLWVSYAVNKEDIAVTKVDLTLLK